MGLVILGFLTFGAILLAPSGPAGPAGAGAGDAAGQAHEHHEHGEDGQCGQAHCGAAPVHPGFASASHVLFHVFHPLHLLFSTIATTAMFWRHERRLLKALLIGVVGSVGICGLSDIVLPYAAGLLLGVREMQLHVCLIEHPGMILPFVAFGLLLGLILPTGTHKGTIFSHTAHVWVSSVASIMYLVSFGLTDWVGSLGLIFIFMVVAVMGPCCASDIVFPLLFVGGKAPQCACCSGHGQHRAGAGEEAAED
jgi:hypothetical protein